MLCLTQLYQPFLNSADKHLLHLLLKPACVDLEPLVTLPTMGNDWMTAPLSLQSMMYYSCCVSSEEICLMNKRNISKQLH